MLHLTSHVKRPYFYLSAYAIDPHMVSIKYCLREHNFEVINSSFGLYSNGIQMGAIFATYMGVSYSLL